MGRDDLRGISIRGLVFRNSRMYREDLTGCDGFKMSASGSVIRACNFTDAKLRYAMFNRADLRDSVFTRADLTSARFCGADLRGCDFTGANLYCADLGDAWIDETTIFTNANLDGACRRNLTGERLRDFMKATATRKNSRPKHFSPELFKQARANAERFYRDEGITRTDPMNP